MIKKLNITVLSNNRAAKRGLLAEHGWSLLIEADGHLFLWDTGQGLVLRHNTEVLGIDLSRVEAVLLSHGHYDHAGGLKYVLEKAPQAKVYCHPHLFNRKFRREPGGRGFRENGLPHFTRETLEAACGELVVSAEPLEIIPGFWMSGQIPRNHDSEMIRNFYSDEACTVPDRILDDQSLFVQTPNGTVVLLACSHAGVINIFNHAARVTGSEKIYAVVGGMHIVDSAPELVQSVLDELITRDVRVLGPTHCTGGYADSELQLKFSGEYLDATVGSRFSLGVE